MSHPFLKISFAFPTAALIAHVTYLVFLSFNFRVGKNASHLVLGAFHSWSDSIKKRVRQTDGLILLLGCGDEFPSGIPRLPFLAAFTLSEGSFIALSSAGKIGFPFSYQSPLQLTSLSVLVIPPKHHPLGASDSPHAPWISPLILTEEMPRVDTLRTRQVEDFICFLQLHLLWVAFSVPSILFPIKLNSLLTGVPHCNGVDGIRRDSSLCLPSPQQSQVTAQ